MIVRKSPSELEKMRRAGMLVYEIHQKLGGHGGRRALPPWTWKWKPIR